MSFFKNIFLFLGALLMPLFGFAQVETEASDISYAPTAADNSLLWEITGKDINEPSYLFGTIHMIDKKDFILTDAVQEAFKKCNKVVFEVNTEDMFDLTTQFSLLMKSFMEDGKTLKDLVSEEDYKLVDQHFKKIGMPLMLLERVKPMILTVFASEDMSGGGKGMGMGDMKSYEIELTELAKKDEKPIDGLETLEYQMSMFDSIPYEDQAKMLVESIKAGSGQDDQFGKMVEMYKAQDLYGLSQMISEEEGIGAYDELLLNNRNRNWIAPMSTMMAIQPTFFAVGAGHLAGEHGVISLLRKEGYTVKPVK
ncbi:MAG: TraB/GumN family protein [Saprospiraceae bacterium]